MNELLLWLLTSIAFLSLTGSGVVIWLCFRLVKNIAETQAPVQLRQLELIDKMATIAVSGDVLAYQGIQAMQARVQEYADYDPSDEGEAQREAELYGRDSTDGDLTADDIAALL